MTIFGARTPQIRKKLGRVYGNLLPRSFSGGGLCSNGNGLVTRFVVCMVTVMVYVI